LEETEEHSQEWLCHREEEPKTQVKNRTWGTLKFLVGYRMKENPRKEGFLTPQTPFGMTDLCFFRKLGGLSGRGGVRGGST